MGATSVEVDMPRFRETLNTFNTGASGAREIQRVGNQLYANFGARVPLVFRTFIDSTLIFSLIAQNSVFSTYRLGDEGQSAVRTPFGT